MFSGSTNGQPALTYQDFDLPTREDLTDGEVLIQLTGITVCISDMHTMSGRRIEPTPSVLGHEGCGTVVASARDGLDAGSYVTFSITDTCGECPQCLVGPQQKCTKLLKYGHVKYRQDSVPQGCFSSHIIVGGGTLIVPLPDTLPPSLASPVNCALATMVEARERSVLALGEKRLLESSPSCLIFGAGLLGLYGCALFKEAGFTVFCTNKSEERRLKSEEFGGRAIAPEDVGDHKFDVVVEVCGGGAQYGEVVNTAIKVLKPGGVVTIVGAVTPNTQLNITGEQIVRKCATILGVHNYQQKQLQTAVNFLKEHQHSYPWDSLVSAPLPMSNFEEVVEVARTMKYYRVLVNPQL